MKSKQFQATLNCKISAEMESDLRELSKLSGKSISCLVREHLEKPIHQILLQLKDKRGNFAIIKIENKLTYNIKVL